jgi:hypothetical protein
LRALRHVGIQLVLAAMMLRALLPDGWMPVASAADGFAIAICTASGPARFVIGDSGQPEKQAPARDSRHLDVCPFSAAPQAATAAPGVVAVEVVTTASFVPLPAQTRTREHAHRYAPQSPRAPPSLV